MTYSLDLRKKVVAFISNGGSQAEAARRFDISLWCVRDWLARADLAPRQKGVPRQRKIDKLARTTLMFAIIPTLFYVSVQPILGSG